MEVKIFTVDAFTNKPFAGNSAGVCLLNELKDTEWMQNVAAEMNLAETAFVFKEDEYYRLRWFTPGAEVDLCGHATLSASHIMWQEGIAGAGEKINFMTRSGMLSAEKDGENITLDFPAVQSKAYNINDDILEALRITPASLSITSFDHNFIAELNSAEEVRNLKPDIKTMLKLPVWGVIVTARSDDSKYDFISRYFAPKVKIDEDPVTGSAHCALAVYWGKKLNKDKFTAYQASKRGGVLYLELAGDRVKLKGNAVTILKGVLEV